MADCVFCKILKKEIPSDLIAEDSDLYAINDINPKAPLHILIIAKKHIPSVRELKENDAILGGKMIVFAKKLAHDKNIKGYKLIFNVGREGGQVIDHIHLHLLGGWDAAPKKTEV